jgi:hypothetical protein
LGQILELCRSNVNFGRLLNRDLRPVIQNAHIRSSNGCADSKESECVPTLIRKTLIALALQGRDHFMHKLGTLREEFICAIVESQGEVSSGRAAPAFCSGR